MDKVLKKIKQFCKKECYIEKITNKKEVESLLDEIENDYNNNNFHFSKELKFKKVMSMGKKRLVVSMTDRLGIEFLLSKYISMCIPTISNNKMQNLKSISNDIISSLKTLNQSKTYTIIRFDFKDFYNSISANYLYEKFLKYLDISNREKEIISIYTNDTRYCFAGLTTSNFFCEIIEKEMQKEIYNQFKNYGIVLCTHYGDDFLVILNEIVSIEETKNIIKKSEQIVFHDKSCDYNKKYKNKEEVYLDGFKYSYITPTSEKKFNFLGYTYTLIQSVNGTDFQIGYVPFLMQRYKDNLKKLILKFPNCNQLKIILKAQTQRISYIENKIGKKEKNTASFFLQQMCMLSPNIDKIDEQTELFLKNVVIDCFKELNKTIPYFIDYKNPNNSYNLYNNLIKNKTLVLSYKNGIQKDELINMLKTLKPAYNEKNKRYFELVRDFIKITKIKF